MGRKKPRKTGNRQHSKGKKRPRGWHRRSKVPVWLLDHLFRRRHDTPDDSGVVSSGGHGIPGRKAPDSKEGT